MQFVSLIPVSRILDELCIISDLVPSEGGVPAYKCFIHSLFRYNWYHRYIYIVVQKRQYYQQSSFVYQIVTLRPCAGQSLLSFVVVAKCAPQQQQYVVVHIVYCLQRDNKIVGQLIRSLQLSLKQVATSHNLLCVLKKYRSGSGGMA